MNFRDILDPLWLPEYEQDMQILHQQLWRLNSCVFLMEKIFPFPFDAVQAPVFPFWVIVTDSMFETCILIIWRVAVDCQGDGVTLQGLRNKIFKNIKNQQMKEKCRAIFKNAKFEENVSMYRKEIVELRHNQIAHFKMKRIPPTLEEIKKTTIMFSELKKCTEELNSFFKIMCFGFDLPLLPPEYDPSANRPIPAGKVSDIEAILDGLVKDSRWLNEPERQYQHWPQIRKTKSVEELNILNKYRAKFGMPKV